MGLAVKLHWLVAAVSNALIDTQKTPLKMNTPMQMASAASTATIDGPADAGLAGATVLHFGQEASVSQSL